MAGEMEKPFKEGYLWLPPHGVISQKIKKAWQKKFCQLFRASKQGIQRLEIYENEEDASKTQVVPIITLENCIKITQDAQKNQPHVFRVVTKTGVHLLAGISEEEMLLWMSALQTVAFLDTASNHTYEEDNDLYCSSGDADIFHVRLISSEASDRNGLGSGDYTLVVAHAELQLRKPNSKETLLTWPYRYIRRYRYSTGKFSFEAGRKCASGEGEFLTEVNNQQEIFRSINAKMKSIKKLLAATQGSTEGLGEVQFQHALSMVARSRSPLPPDPTATQLSTVSQLSTASLSSTSSSSSLSLVPPPPRPNKPKPKPRSLPNVFLHPVSTASNYDRLQFFGSTAKLNVTSGYSTPLTVARPIEQPTSPARLADDSHRGYGMIRKKSDDSTSQHSLKNNLEYAIVLKPHVV